MKKVIWCISALLLVAYVVFIFIWMGTAIEGGKCTGMEIYIADTAASRFVTAAEIAREIDDLPSRCKGMPLRDINTDSIEAKLNRIDKIESASCLMLNSGKVIVSVKPMQPVARVFEEDYSYYINRNGKRISADARYYLDVPVISGVFDAKLQAQDLLPLVEYIYSDPTWSTFVSMIKTDMKHNIILVPVIRGHVINFGDMSDMENKFTRLRQFYKDVMPVKGWNYYDTIAVKWTGQVVATKRKKKLADTNLAYVDDSELEAVNTDAMLADETTDTVTIRNRN
ncbi:MAG: hypothetical protein IJY30_00895 [Muribaculaceae bacterium]|nr:hypothetical protein [Muribaculaceae bacterium]